MEQAFATPLSLGNKKVGRVWTFSLPSLLTCPGASAWCRGHCYARRMEQFRPNCRLAYLRNLHITEDPVAFVRGTLESLPNGAQFVRIHVGGDFHTSHYSKAWVQICEARPDVSFWGYTRSWTVPDLVDALEELRRLPNVSLFGSTDTTMPLPPNGWRVAFIDIDSRASGMPCRHQQGEVDSCLECGYCFRENAGNVVFKVH